MGSELNRDHPLWEMWFVDGLAGGRWAIIGKVHHTLVDGVAGAGLLEVMFSDQPEPAPQPDSPAWRVEPAPSETRLAADAVGQLAQSALAVGRGVATSLTHPGDTVRALRTIGSGLSSWLGEVLVPTPPVSVDGPVGPQRRWTWVEVPLETAKAIRAERGGTVNDVILAAVTRGFRDLLRHRGEDPQKTEMRTLVPVSVRSEAGRLDNEVSALVAELPVGIEIPELRYEAVRQETRWLKLSHESEAGEALSTLADVVPPPLLAYGTRAVLGLLRRQRNINTVVTNVPGPQFPLFAAGRRLLAYHPYVPVALGVRVTVAIFSYDGRLSFGLTGDETVSDLDELARGIEAGIAELQVDPG
jgi:diacylglycerol O-acyltransferase